MNQNSQSRYLFEFFKIVSIDQNRIETDQCLLCSLIIPGVHRRRQLQKHMQQFHPEIYNRNNSFDPSFSNAKLEDKSKQLRDQSIYGVELYDFFRCVFVCNINRQQRHKCLMCSFIVQTIIPQKIKVLQSVNYHACFSLIAHLNKHHREQLLLTIKFKHWFMGRRYHFKLIRDKKIMFSKNDNDANEIKPVCIFI